MLVPSSNRISVPSRLVASRLRTVIVVGSDISVSELKFTVADRPTDAACDEWTCSRAGRNYSAATAAADAAATAILALAGLVGCGAAPGPTEPIAAECAGAGNDRRRCLKMMPDGECVLIVAGRSVGRC